jgi:hypothetical protein
VRWRDGVKRVCKQTDGRTNAVRGSRDEEVDFVFELSVSEVFGVLRRITVHNLEFELLTAQQTGQRIERHSSFGAHETGKRGGRTVGNSVFMAYEPHSTAQHSTAQHSTAQMA